MEEKKTIGQATASLVLGILSWIFFGLLTAIPAVICGHVAKSKIKRNPDELGGEGMALAGLIMGYVSIGFSLLIMPAILAAIAIPLMTGNIDRASAMEGQAGCSAVSTMLRVHWAEHQSFEGVDSVDDLASFQSGDLDGMHFDDDDYTLVSLVDSHNYIISATGGGDETNIDVTLKVSEGETYWEMDFD